MDERADRTSGIGRAGQRAHRQKRVSALSSRRAPAQRHVGRASVNIYFTSLLLPSASEQRDELDVQEDRPPRETQVRGDQRP